MAMNDPQRVIADYLCEPARVLSDLTISRGQARIISGGFGARPETLRFVKVREIPGRQLHAVLFEDEQKQPQFFICYVVRDNLGHWHYRGGGGGSKCWGLVHNDQPPIHGSKEFPHDFFAGGYVPQPELDVERVRLISQNGLVLEDTVQDGLVLFVTDQNVCAPIQAELYDHTSQLVAQHTLG